MKSRNVAKIRFYSFSLIPFLIKVAKSRLTNNRHNQTITLRVRMFAQVGY